MLHGVLYNGRHHAVGQPACLQNISHVTPPSRTQHVSQSQHIETTCYSSLLQLNINFHSLLLSPLCFIALD